MTLEDFKNLPNKTEEDQKAIGDLFADRFWRTKEFVALRRFVVEHEFGFGASEFYPLHEILVKSLPEEITFLEIGVYRGQVLALYRILEKMYGKSIDIYGVTPLDSSDNHIESDYRKDIGFLHDSFNLKHPGIIKGSSMDPKIIKRCKDMELDILYVDGGHSKEAVTSDILNYSPLVKKGGYMVIDDSANNMDGTFEGGWWGLQQVSDVVDSLLPPKVDNPEWEYIGNIIHNRVWRRR